MQFKTLSKNNKNNDKKIRIKNKIKKSKLKNSVKKSNRR
jgi:hypothetical protein